MVSRHVNAVVLAALLAAPPSTAQDERLPLVNRRAPAPDPAQSRYVTEGPDATVFLAVEPIRLLEAPSLLEAARNNDYPGFSELYRTAAQRGEDPSRFRALNDLWEYSVTSPIGAFYDAAMRDRIARAFPGFREYIEPFRIVDSSGNIFYPTAETRAFLIDMAARGTTARVVVADAGAADVRSPVSTRVNSTPAPAARREATDLTARSGASSVAAAPQSSRGLSARTASSTNSPNAVSAKGSNRALERAARSAPPVAAQLPIPDATPAAAVQPRQADRSTSSTAVAETVPQPEAALATPEQTSAPTVAEQAAPSPVVPAATERATPAATPVSQPQRDTTSRGLLLLIIGLAGIGALAMVLRTPKQTPAEPLAPASPKAEPLKPVEPRPENADEAGRRRRTGSRR